MPRSSGQPRNEPALPVFIKRGDARPEVDRLLPELGPTPGSTGFNRYFYVAKADQTVVMVDDRAAPLALALRARAGWLEPMEGS